MDYRENTCESFWKIISCGKLSRKLFNPFLRTTWHKNTNFVCNYTTQETAIEDGFIALIFWKKKVLSNNTKMNFILQ